MGLMGVPNKKTYGKNTVPVLIFTNIQDKWLGFKKTDLPYP